MTIRLLEPGDETALEAFLRGRNDTSMFLRGNLRDHGLDNSQGERDEPFQGRYLGSFDRQGEMSGVLGHFRNGMIQPQAPEPLLIRKLAAALMAEPDLKISGFTGASVQVDDLILHLNLGEADYPLRVKEDLYALRLDQLTMPEIGASPKLTARLAVAADLDHLIAWRQHYDQETSLGGSSDELETTLMMIRWVDLERCWVLESDGVPVAMSAFNAVMPDCVQVGSVYTIPEQRNRGHARYLVAESLQAVRDQGVEKALLFTKTPAAASAYRAIGFTRIGDYSLAMLRNPVTSRDLGLRAGVLASCQA